MKKKELIRMLELYGELTTEEPSTGCYYVTLSQYGTIGTCDLHDAYRIMHEDVKDALLKEVGLS
jgi:hypothetical protein